MKGPVGAGYVRQAPVVEGRTLFVSPAPPEYIDPRLLPYRWSHRFVLEGGCWHGFPAPYAEALARIVVAEDPDERRTPSSVQILSGFPVASDTSAS